MIYKRYAIALGCKTMLRSPSPIATKTATKNDTVLRFGGRQQIARRVFWEWFVGEIPTGQAVAKEMNLKCSGRLCCNPAHLRLRNISDPVDWATCPKGHRLIPSNVMVEKVNGIEVERCKACRLEYWKNRNAQDSRRRAGPCALP